MSNVKDEKEKWIAHNLSETQSILIHDLCTRAFDAGVLAERERIQKIFFERSEIWIVGDKELFPQEQEK